MTARILIVEDDPEVASLLMRTVKKSGRLAVVAHSLEEARAAVETHTPEVILLDYELPDGNAFDFLRWARERDLSARIVILTGHGSIPLAVDAIKLGADQFLTKPVRRESLLVLLEQLLEHNRETRRDRAQRHAEQRHSPNPFVGTSDAIRSIEGLTRSVAESSVPILLLGETGSGKSLLARWIHQQSDRHEEAFVDLNCAGLSRELLESELFGHKRGSFTGANADKRGLLDLAHHGTLFLDEIGDLDLSVQPKLLKVLEDKTFRRLGDVIERSVDVRLITATHKDLAKMSQSGAFRNDLLFRINTVTIELPPLRQRRADIVPMASEMLQFMSRPQAGVGVALSKEAEKMLEGHDWPGNAREMKNVLERALLFTQTSEVPASALKLGSARPSRPVTQRPIALADAERKHVMDVLRSHSGNVPQAAATLGMPRSSLYAKLKRWGVKSGAE